MKKTIFSALIFVLFLVITNCVLADMDSPFVAPYTAYVSNAEGATYYTSEYDTKTKKEYMKPAGKLNNNEEVSVTYEYTIDNVNYASIYVNNKYLGYIKIDDISISENEKYTENVRKEEKNNIKVVSKDGIDIYDNPGWSNNKTGVKIPFGENIEAYAGEKTNSWYYVEYKGTSGWICILNGNIAFKYDYYESLYTYDDCKIYDENNNVIMEIPANTKVDEFLELDPWSRSFYVTYNGTSGRVSKDEIAVDYNAFSRLTPEKNEITLYEKADKTGNITYQGTISDEEKENFVVLYEQYDIRGNGWYYLKNNDKEGWYETEEETYPTFGYTAKVKNPNGAKYYVINDDNTLKEVGKYEFDDEIEISNEVYENGEWYATYYKNESYYIKRSDLENLNLKVANIVKEEKNEIAEESSPINNTDDTSTVQISEDDTINNEMKTPQIVTVCVVVAILVFLMAIVIIVLVNKNKKAEK